MSATSRHTGRVTPFWTEYERDFLHVSGADALTYLHSQISQDIRGLADGESAYSFVLEPTGKIDALVRIARVAADDYMIDTDPGFGEGLLARLNRFKIRVKVDVAAVPWSCIAIRGMDASTVTVTGIAVPAWGQANCVDVISADVHPHAPTASLRRGSADELELARIRAGWPAMGREITDVSIPAESGVVDLAVNFTKGCYPGQELVERMDSRGSQAPRFVRQLRSPVAEVFVGDEITRADTVIGHVTSVAPDFDDTSTEVTGWLALGVVARSAQPGDAVIVRGHELILTPARV